MPDLVRRLTQHRRPSLAVLLLAAATAFPLLLASGCGGDQASAGGPPWGGGGGGAAAVVRAAEVEHGSFTARAEYVGTLEARSQADLYARTSGPIVEIRADLGDPVREGQVLAVIESDEERERIEQARANLRMAEATLAQRRSALNIARTTAERSASLFEQDLVSRQQLDSLEAEVEGARAQVQLAQAQVEQVRSALSSAQVELEQTRVVAPFDGVVGRRYLDRGDFAATNSPVMSVVDLSTIKTTVPVPERDAASIEVGQPATVRVGSLPGQEFPGRVARMAAVFDPESATTRAEIEVDNPDGRLKPGMFATVEIALADEAEALLVPTEAVLDEEGRSWVFVVATKTAPEGEAREGGGEGGGPPAEAGPPPTVAQRREVRTLGTARDGAVVAIEGNLKPGQRVIVLGHEGLADGAPVTVATEGDDEQAVGVDEAASLLRNPHFETVLGASSVLVGTASLLRTPHFETPPSGRLLSAGRTPGFRTSTRSETPSGRLLRAGRTPGFRAPTHSETPSGRLHSALRTPGFQTPTSAEEPAKPASRSAGSGPEEVGS